MQFFKAYRIIVFLVLLVIGIKQPIWSQHQLNWANTIEGSSNSSFTSLDVKGSYVFLCGATVGTNDFDPGTGVYNLTSNGSVDIVICKYDISGNLVWAKNIGGVSGEYATSINVDENNNLIVSGYFLNGTVDFDPGPGVANLSTTEANGFVLKLDSAGNFIWVKGFESTTAGSECSILKVLTGVNSEVYFLGSFSGDVDLDPGIGTLPFSTSSDFYTNAFLGSFDASGNLIYIDPFLGSNNCYPTSFSLDQNENIFVGFLNSGTTDYDPSAGVDTVISSFSYDGVLVKLDAAGNFIWKKVLNSDNNNGPIRLVCTSTNDLVVFGNFSGTTDFDPGSGTNNITSTNTGTDCYLLKLDASGNFDWVKMISGTGSELVRHLVIDGSDNFYLTGQFATVAPGAFDLDPGVAEYSVMSTGAYDPFLIKLNSVGNFVWGGVIEGTLTEEVWALGVDANESFYFAGELISTNTDLDPTLQFFIPGNSGGRDAFFVKLDSTCSSYSQSTIIDACQFYTVPSGDETYYIPGSYQDTLINHNGCDSVLNLVVNIETIDTTVTVNGITMSTVFSSGSATYQWLDCNNSFAIIPGATNSSYTATSNGNYAAQINYNGCTDITVCTTINTVGINENQQVQFSVYPNPTEGEFLIDFKNEYKNVHVKLINCLGQTIFSNRYENTNQIEMEFDDAFGIYFLFIETDSFTANPVVLFKQ